MLNVKQFSQLPLKHLIIDLLLIRILDFAKFDGHDLVSLAVQRRPHDTLPPCADLLEELILMEL